MDGVCCDAAGHDTTSTTYTYTANTWYHLYIIQSWSSGTPHSATFYISTDDGTLVWHEELVSTHIPDAEGEEVGVGAVWYKTGELQRICHVDWMVCGMDYARLVRGHWE